MAPPKSSAGTGSKDVNGCKDTRLQNYLNDEFNREALQSSWIRRLHLRPTSHSPSPPTSPPSPVVITTENPSPATTPPPTALNNSPSTTDSGFAMIGHLTDTSSHESRTPTSMLDASTTLFLHRLLKLRKEKPPLTADPESFSVSGFGPFQVQTRRVSSTTDVHLKQNDQVKDDSVAGMNDGWNFNYSRNSSSDACFPTLQTMTRFVVEEEEEEEEQQQQQQQQKMEKNSPLQQRNCLPPKNHRTLFTGKILFSSESNCINHNSSPQKPQEMLNVQKRRLSDEQHNNTHSPFLQYWSSLKKLNYTRANPVNTFGRNGCLFRPSGEEADNNFNNSNLDSCNLNHSWPVGGKNKFSSSSRNLVAGAQRFSLRHFPANPQPMIKASNEIKYFSRSGGIAHHENCHDDVAGTFYQDSHLTTQNIALRQHERQTPACSNETGDPSSFWNMDSFQRAEMVSSIFRACRTGNKKRNAKADVFLSVKSRKLDPEG